MIRSMAVTHDLQLIKHMPLEKLSDPNIQWFWVDFDEPSEAEANVLDSRFHFHPLAIEDCFHLLQRPKMDHYEDILFFVVHGINQTSLKAEEVDFFLGPNYIVTFHLNKSAEIDEAWKCMTEHKPPLEKGPVYVAYLMIDKLVDNYFPSLYQIEDHLNDLEGNEKKERIQTMLDRVYEIRSNLLKLRRTVVPMRDLIYRVINSDKIYGVKEQLVYFTDIYDHLLKLSEMIESNRDVTADLRDSYNSLRSNRMNAIMKTLTVITTIFMPLTFLAGIYGMNFEVMPELKWQWGYFSVLGLMVVIGCGMFYWFWRKGWFE